MAADVATISARVADAVTHTIRHLPRTVSDDDDPALSMFDDADFLASVHQAAGIVSVQLACQTTDAVALLLPPQVCSSGLVLAGAASASLPPQLDLGPPASQHLRLPSRGSDVFAVVVVLAAHPPVARVAMLPDVVLSPCR